MKFFFNVRSHDVHEIDHDGMELPSIEEANNEAQKAAREMIAELVIHDQRIDGLTIDILDEEGKLLSSVPFRDMLKLD